MDISQIPLELFFFLSEIMVLPPHGTLKHCDNTSQCVLTWHEPHETCVLTDENTVFSSA